MTSLRWSVMMLAFLAFPLVAQNGPGQGHRAEKVARALHLTEAQKTTIKGIRDKHQPDLAARRETVKQAQQALRTALQEAATPETQLKALYDKAAAARFEMMLARRSVHQEVQAVLTPEQREKAAELRGMARERMRERLHQRREPRGMAG